MLDYYYIDLYFDARAHSFRSVVDSCVTSLTEAGCLFKQVTMAEPETRRSVSLGEHVALSPADLPAVAAAYTNEMLEEGKNFVPFPPLGRIMFSYAFKFDEDILDDIHEEEEDSHSSCEDMGLTFMYTAGESGGRIKASLSFWEEYLLKLGTPETQVENMRAVMGMIKSIARKTPPFFGAMNTEMHLDTDSSLALLMQGKPPEGNEFIIVGGPLMQKLPMNALSAEGYQTGPLHDGGCIIQMADKWEGLTAV